MSSLGPRAVSGASSTSDVSAGSTTPPGYRSVPHFYLVLCPTSVGGVVGGTKVGSRLCSAVCHGGPTVFIVAPVSAADGRATPGVAPLGVSRRDLGTG